METTKKALHLSHLFSKSFFAVISKETSMERVKTLLLGDTKEKAICLWNKHNDNGYANIPLPKGWMVIEVEAKNVC